MSKVYEALRQREHELSASAENQESAAGTVSKNDSQNASYRELDFTGHVLESALATGRPLENAGERIPFNSAAENHPRHPHTSNNGFRRLTSSCKEESRVVFSTDPRGLAAEQFRFLRRTLELKFPEGAVLLITSPAPRDGKTLTAVNLCACMAESGKSVILLDGDVRQPSLHRVLGTDVTSPGIEDVLAEKVDPPQAIHFVEDLSIHVAMVATPPSDPARLIGGTGIKRLLTWARERFSWVIIDSPPVLPAADVAQLLAVADAVLLVVRTHSTPRELTIRAVEMLGDHLSGVVLNEASVGSNPYYRYSYDYGRGNGRR